MAKQKKSTSEKAKAQIKYSMDEDYVDLTGNLNRKVDVISTGSVIINKILGCGGIPRGRITELFGPPSSGKCVREGTYLCQSEKGLVKIEKIFDDLSDKPKSNSAVSYKEHFYGKDGYKESSHFYNGGIKKTKRIKSRYGYEVEGTCVHPVLIMNTSGDLVWKKLGEIEKGDYICIQRNQQCFGKDYIKLDWKYKKESRHETNTKKYQFPNILDEKLASLLAYIIAEGTTTYKTSLGVSQKEKETADFIGFLTLSLFGKKIRLKKGSEKDYDLSSKQIRTFLYEVFGVDYVKSTKKEIPDLIMQSPKTVQQAFLRSYFEAEGSVTPDWVEISSASKWLIHQLQLMLLNLGIIANQRVVNNCATNSPNPTKRDYYGLCLTGNNINIFAKEIGFESSRKIKKLNDLIQKRTNLQKRSNVKTVYGNDIVKRVEAIKYRGDNLSYITWEKIKDCSPESHQELDSFSQIEQNIENQFFYDLVAEITESKGQVYDLTIPDGHNFVSNGIVSHNTTLATSVCISAQKAGGTCLYLDFENAFDPGYAEAIGLSLDPNQFALYQPNYFEKAAELITKSLATHTVAKTTGNKKPIPENERGLWLDDNKTVGIGVPDVIVIDSIAALLPKKEYEGDNDSIGEIGLLPRLLSKYFRKLVTQIKNSDVAVVLVNQERTNIKMGPFAAAGPDYETTGGKALKFYASVRMRLTLRKKEKARVYNEILGKPEELPIQNVVKCTAVKNKVGTPYRSGDFVIRYGEGVDNIRSILDIAINTGVVSKGGAWLEYKSTVDEARNFKVQGVEKLRAHVIENDFLIDELQDRIEGHLQQISKRETATDLEAVGDIELISEEYSDE